MYISAKKSTKHVTLQSYSLAALTELHNLQTPSDKMAADGPQYIVADNLNSIPLPHATNLS
jgi:hypothetical protein